MPELPEVEISRRQLARWVGGRPLRAVRVEDPAVVRSELSSRPSLAWPEGVEHAQRWVGKRASEPVRHGKRLGWAFGAHGFVAHYGMTGHWAQRAPDEAPPKLARLGLVFDEVTAWYVDGRRFGCVVPVRSAQLAAVLRGDCGPDAWDARPDGAALRAWVSCRLPIKVALMEQRKIAGLGNIHAAEACFRSRISPRLPADKLDDRQWQALAQAVTAQLGETIAAEEHSDDLRYVNLGGPNPFSVYDRADEPCLRCGTPIRAESQAGRTTFWCPSCQG